MLEDNMSFKIRKKNRFGHDINIYTPQKLWLISMMQCVLADDDMAVYEMLSVGSKAVAGVPPWGLQMYSYLVCHVWLKSGKSTDC